MPRRTDDYRGMANASRLRVLRAVLDEPGIGLAELAELTDLHVNTLRDHVRVLEDHGLIVSAPEHRASRGRPRTVFRAVIDPAESAVALKRLATASAHGDILRRIAPSHAVEELGEEGAHQVDALYEHLDDAGLEPDIDEQEWRVDLRPCPFHDLVDGNVELACGVHERLIRIILKQAGGPVELEELVPFTTPHRCAVYLRTHRVEGSRGQHDGSPTADGDHRPH